jgi:hypothetical protein
MRAAAGEHVVVFHGCDNPLSKVVPDRFVEPAEFVPVSAQMLVLT